MLETVTCSKNLNIYELPEIVVNGPNKKAQVGSKTNHCGLGSQDLNNKGREMEVNVSLNQIEKECDDVEHVARQLLIRSEGTENGMCVVGNHHGSNNAIANYIIDEMGRNEEDEEEVHNNETRNNGLYQLNQFEIDSNSKYSEKEEAVSPRLVLGEVKNREAGLIEKANKELENVGLSTIVNVNKECDVSEVVFTRRGLIGVGRGTGVETKLPKNGKKLAKYENQAEKEVTRGKGREIENVRKIDKEASDDAPVESEKPRYNWRGEKLIK